MYIYHIFRPVDKEHLLQEDFVHQSHHDHLHIIYDKLNNEVNPIYYILYSIVLSYLFPIFIAK